MRKTPLLTGLIALFLLYSGCSRNNNSQPSNDKLVNLVKASLQLQKMTPGSNAAFIDTLQKGAAWSKLAHYAINNQEFLVYVPVTYNNATTGLVFILDKKNIVETSYLAQLTGMSNAPDPAMVMTGFYSYQMQNATVDITAYAFSKNLIWEMNYSGGMNLYRRSVSAGNPPSSNGSGRRITVSGEDKKQVTGGTNCTSYYLVTYWDDGSEDWDYIGTNCTADCTLTIPVLAGSAGGNKLTDAVTTTCGGGGGGGGSSSTTTQTQQDITSELTNQCFQAVLNKLMSPGVNSQLLNLFQSTFGSSDEVNITFNEAPVAGNSATNDASTSSNLNGNIVNVYTTLSEGKLVGAAEEYIAETMLHEIIHGYYAAIGGFNELQQHEAMVGGWINMEVASLQELFPNLTLTNARCLVLGGMADVQANDPAYFNQTLAGYGLTLAQVQTTNMMYSGGLGTGCPRGNGNGGGGGNPQP